MNIYKRAAQVSLRFNLNPVGTNGTGAVSDLFKYAEEGLRKLRKSLRRELSDEGKIDDEDEDFKASVTQETLILKIAIVSDMIEDKQASREKNAKEAVVRESVETLLNAIQMADDQDAIKALQQMTPEQRVAERIRLKGLLS